MNKNLKIKSGIININDHLCNFCGLSCKLTPYTSSNLSENSPKINYEYLGGLINCDVMGGYESTPGNGNGALDDMTSYIFSICEFCLDHLFTQFKIPPKVIDYPDHKKKWITAKLRVENDEWRKTKDKFITEWLKRNEARENKAEK